MKRIFTFLFTIVASTMYLFADYYYNEITIGDLRYNLHVITEVILVNQQPAEVVRSREATVHSVADAGLTAIVVPEFVLYDDGTGSAEYEVNAIRDEAFAHNTTIQSVILPNSIAEIGANDFNGCTNLASINIPNRATHIGAYAFYQCTSLTSIDIPASVLSFGGQTFSGCTGLVEITLHEGLQSIGGTAMQGCTGLTSISLPSTLKSLGLGAFSQCTSLESIELPDSITEIERRCFASCTKLTSIELPSRLKVISSELFDECSALTSVTIHDSVTTIESGAFKRCTKLTSLTIPNSVTEIGGSAFFRSGLVEITLPNTLKSLGNTAFMGCADLLSITIPDSITSIGGETFWDCNALTSVYTGNYVRTIGGNAFCNCLNLASVVLGDSVREINDRAFSGCQSLAFVQLGASVETIKSDAFYNTPVSHLVVSATTPPSAGSNCGLNNTSCKLYVPAEAIDTYKSTDWWKDFYRIRVIGSYATVTFQDWDGTVLDEQIVDFDDAAIAPANPARTGYTFIGWDEDFSSISADLVVTAQYEINTYRVEFHDWDGSLLKVDSVNYLSAAVAPADPERDWHTFSGWDNDFSAITGDLIVTAQYTEGKTIEQTVHFANGIDGSEITDKVQSIAFPVPPEVPGYTFIGWRSVTAMVGQLTIEAVYESDIPTADPTEVSIPGNPGLKLIREGNVYILHNEHVYTITGNKVE